MPQKTKKQKILAEYRRKIKSLQSEEIIPVKQQQIITPIKPKIQNNAVIYHPSEYEKNLAGFTRADLKKTLIIISFLFALEFLVFFASLKGVFLK